MKLFVALIATLMLQVSCLPQRQAKVVEIKPVKVAEMTIVQGKTTKQEILDKLGAPRSFHNSVYTYWSPDNSMEYIDITYIEKDGTKWNFCVANRPECKLYFTVHHEYKGDGIDKYVDSISF